jgi:hypothetical protein
MVIGTSRCAHVLCYLFCCRVVRAHSKNLMCSTTADVSGEPAMRSARANARRRIASCAHCGMGCSHAPRPGRLPATSTVTEYLPFPVNTATTRSSSTANSRFRQPTHVRTGPPMRRCAEAEVSRWITAQFTFTEPVVRTTRRVPRMIARLARARLDELVSSRRLPVVGHPVGGAVLGLGRRLTRRIPADVDTPSGEPGR